MTKKLKLISCTLLLILSNCSKDKKIVIAETDVKSVELEALIIEYEPNIAYQHRLKKKSYSINEQLDSVFSKLNPTEIMGDTIFRKNIVFLLEKKFLWDLRSSSKLNHLTINASAWSYDENHKFFALNIFNKVKASDYSYNNYKRIGQDFTCAINIVKEASTYRKNNEFSKVHSEILKILNCTNQSIMQFSCDNIVD